MKQTDAFRDAKTAAPLTAENLKKLEDAGYVEPPRVKTPSASSGKWSEREIQRVEVKAAEKQTAAR